MAQARRLGSLPREVGYQAANTVLPLRLDWEQSRALIQRHGLDHPTEAQWEYAAGAGAGEAARGPTHAWLSDAGGALHGPHDVGALLPNAFGLHDLLGNVSEWCRDWLILRAYSTLPSRPGDGLKATALRGVGRIIRGGCFADTRESASAHITQAGRAGAAPTTGVRPVLLFD